MSLASLSQAAGMLRELGPAWFAWRGAYEVGLRSGVLRALFPPRDPLSLLAGEMGLPAAGLAERLAALWESEGGRFFADGARGFPRVRDPEAAVRTADDAVRGRLPLFHGAPVERGDPVDWLRNPVTGTRFPGGAHWTAVPDLSPALGDIKLVWDASRFGHAHALVRAYAATGDERYPEAFWRQVEGWTAANPAERGPNWRCAQEVSLRALAWTFALHAFRRSPASTPERVGRLVALLWYGALHVERIHWYATRCVRNDHALSEGVGMLAVGTLFPFLPGAARLAEKGMRSVVREVSWQVRDDGTYVLPSLHYARMAGELLAWAAALARAAGTPLPAPVADRARRLLRFLLAVHDAETGAVPNHGANDGTLLLPLSSRPYADFRPALAALAAVLREPSPYPPGPWDEAAAWLGAEPVRGPGAAPPGEAEPAQAFGDGGYYVLRGRGTSALIRCGTHRHRPLQADMLHLDVRYGAHPVLVDAGSFSYNAPAPWSAYFPGTAAHNTVGVDGRDQMRRGPRFVWLGWTRARLLRWEPGPAETVFEGEHFGYAPVVHRRRVTLRGALYVVVDDLASPDAAEHDFRLHWLVDDLPLETAPEGARIALPSGPALGLRIRSSRGGAVDWKRASEDDPPRGWQSRLYGERTPAWSAELVSRGSQVRFVTVLGPVEQVNDAEGEVARLLAEG